MLLYTPPESWAGIGTVMLSKRPALSVSPSAYRLLLRDRLQAMIAEANQDDVEEVLARLETQENLRLSVKPKAAEILVEDSQTLRELAAYPCEPIPPEAWGPDPETAEALGRECAVEYLEMLVR